MDIIPQTRTLSVAWKDVHPLPDEQSAKLKKNESIHRADHWWHSKTAPENDNELMNQSEPNIPVLSLLSFESLKKVNTLGLLDCTNCCII